MTQAIFLSYASQDADAARRICDALRTAGLEVWFDQSELRGGDAWDASIRKQIKECALFVPIISANTNEREEGYFRREWNLAVSRMLDMADNKSFLVPVMLEGVAEPEANVPDKFRERQWSRLNDVAAIENFATRIGKLITGSASPDINAMKGAPVAEVARAALAKKPEENASIAVLAFANRSGNADDEYFSDGLADELLNVLSKIRGLRVAARTSAFSFKGKSATIGEIGRALNVATVLEGSVRKSGNRARISVQLVNVTDGYHLWSETYDRMLDDIFAVQDDIARSVVAELRRTLLAPGPEAETPQRVGNEINSAVAGRSANSEAYSLYLKARFHVERLTPADILEAVGDLKAAIALDGDFALAHAALAHALTQGAIKGAVPLTDAIEQARAAGRRALGLQHDLVEAHLALGEVQLFQDWDWHSAEASFKQVLLRAPGNAEALRLIAVLMTVLGRYQESIAYFDRAIALDPLNSSAYCYLGLPHEALGNSVIAERATRQAFRISPEAIAHRYFLCMVLTTQRRFDEAIEIARGDGTEWSRLSGLAFIYRAAGQVAESDPHLKALIEKYGDITAMQVAIAYAVAGEAEAAFRWLEHAYATSDAGRTFLLAWAHHFKALHSDPRWATLVKKMRLA